MNLANEGWFQKIMKSEGGLNLKEPASVGGKSYAGISQKTYLEWIDKKSQFNDLPVDVEHLAGGALGTKWEKDSPLQIPEEYNVRVDVIVAFYEDYFKMARLDLIPECLKYIHADFFVNSRFNANKILQRIVGFEGKDVDGILGPASRERLSNLLEKFADEIKEDSNFDDHLIMEYHQQKINHYESIKDKNRQLYDNNIRGWLKRSQHILAELEDYFHDDDPTVSAIHDDEEESISLFDDHHIDTDIDNKDDNSQIVSQVTENIVKMLPEIIEDALKSIRSNKYKE